MISIYANGYSLAFHGGGLLLFSVVEVIKSGIFCGWFIRINKLGK